MRTPTLPLSEDDPALVSMREEGIPVGPLMDHLIRQMEGGCVHSRSVWVLLCMNVWGVDPVEMLKDAMSQQSRVRRTS